MYYDILKLNLYMRFRQSFMKHKNYKICYAWQGVIIGDKINFINVVQTT